MRRHPAPLSLVAAALLLVACGGAAPATSQSTQTATQAAAPKPGAGGNLIEAAAEDPDSLDPAHTVSGPSFNVFQYIYDPLIVQTGPGQYQGEVASSWTISPDGKTYDFKIRHGLVFSNGDPLNADAVVFTFQRIMDPATKSPDVSLMGPIASVKKVNDYEVQINMSKPDALELDNLKVAYMGIVDPKAVQSEGANYGRQPVGSGPFMLKEWVSGDHITLVPNPKHQDFSPYLTNKAEPYLSELRFDTIPNEETQIAALQSGQVNLMNLPQDKYQEWKDKPGYQLLYNKHSTAIAFLEFHSQAGPAGATQWLPPFDDIRVRQAVGYAVDPSVIIQDALFGLADRNYGALPTGVTGYNPAIQNDGFTYDPSKAKQLLDAAGWTAGSGGVRTKDGQPLSIQLWAFSDPPAPSIATIVQNELQQIGFKVNLQVMPVATFIAKAGAGPEQLDVSTVGWPSPTILNILSSFTWGMGNYRPADYMALINQAGATVDPTQRDALYLQAEQQLLKDAVMVPLYSPWSVLISSDQVHGLLISPGGSLNVQDAYVNP